MEKEFYTVDKISKILEVNVMTIYRYIKKRKLHAYKFGKEYRIEKESFEIFLKSHLINS